MFVATSCQRNLLYTGVTRGKRLVLLVGQKKAVAIAVRNVSGRRRWSNLGELDDNSMPGIDHVVEAIAKLDALFALAVHAEQGSVREITFGSSRSASESSSSKLDRNSATARV